MSRVQTKAERSENRQLKLRVVLVVHFILQLAPFVIEKFKKREQNEKAVLGHVSTQKRIIK